MRRRDGRRRRRVIRRTRRMITPRSQRPKGGQGVGYSGAAAAAGGAQRGGDGGVEGGGGGGQRAAEVGVVGRGGGGGVGSKSMMLQPVRHERSAVVIRAGNEVAVAGGGRHGRLLGGHCRQLGVQQHGVKRRRWSELLLLLLLAKQVTEVLLVQVGVEDIGVGICRRRFLNRRRTEGYPGTSGGRRRRIGDVRLYRRRRR